MTILGIQEKELLDALKNEAVTQMYVRRQQNGTYRVLVNLSWKSGEYELLTTRKHPREWASLDRFISYLREVHSKMPPIQLAVE